MGHPSAAPAIVPPCIRDDKALDVSTVSVVWQSQGPDTELWRRRVELAAEDAVITREETIADAR